jgi:glycosyltransferase involved in cell wall biosynthesis
MLVLKLASEASRGDSDLRFAAVAIARNEGERLQRCLESLSSATRIVYVDSGSVDGSAQWAREHTVDVIELDMKSPFTAARARNAGFRHLREAAPDLTYIQFVDGDCELNRQWPEQAVHYLDAHPEIAAVCGRRRERFPEKSIYNWLCDIEWNVTPGGVRAFAGDVMIRATALEEVGGYRDDLIAGEEPELCVRLRAAGWRIWRLPSEMTLHDAAMIRFGQWWQRAVRSGYAFAQGAHLHGGPPERHWVWESRRAWLWGVWLPIACVAASAELWPWGLLAWLIYPLQVLRQTARNNGPLTDRTTIAVFQVLARFPEALGQFMFLWHRLLGARPGLLEYK